MSRFEDHPDDIVPGMKPEPVPMPTIPPKPSPPVQKPLRQKDEDERVSRAGQIVGMIFATVIFAFLLAIVVIILVGIAHGLLELFF